jgi:ketosteroid isomerase-like protein
MKNALLLSTLLLLVVLGLVLSGARAQSNVAPNDLFKTIEALDTQLFDAYNHCDLTTISSLVAEDLEFYHDKTGLARGRQALVDGIRNNICGKVTRELVPGTLQVDAIAGYGAVEIGVHRFHHPGNADDVGEAQFVTLWQNKDGAWQVTRVISFDHHSATK